MSANSCEKPALRIGVANQCKMMFHAKWPKFQRVILLLPRVIVFFLGLFVILTYEQVTVPVCVRMLHMAPGINFDWHATEVASRRGAHWWIWWPISIRRYHKDNWYTQSRPHGGTSNKLRDRTVFFFGDGGNLSKQPMELNSVELNYRNTRTEFASWSRVTGRGLENALILTLAPPQNVPRAW